MHINPDAYCRHIGSTPKAPIDPGTVEFIKGKPAIVEPATKAVKDLHFYVKRIAALAEAVEHDSREYRKAVAELKASGLWKERFKTWKRTCRECLGISPQRAHVLISELTESYEQDNDETSTPIDSSARSDELETLNSLPDPLADCEPAKAANAKPDSPEEPAPVPKANAAPAAEAKANDHSRDAIGFPIPKELMERWNQRQEVQDRITAASRLRCALEEITNKGHQNPLYGCYDWQGMIRTIGQLQFHLGQCKPEVVCYDCDGLFLAIKPTKGGSGITRHCHACDDRGFMTRKQWDDYADSKLEIVKETVAARLARCKKD